MATIYISIGSNCNAEKQIRFAIKQLEQMFSRLVISRVYESEAVGFKGDNFLNLVVKASTKMTISQVENIFKTIENKAGRRRDVPKFSDRTLDIDLLLFDQLVCEKPVQLPRDEILKHAFVLLPLSEVEPELEHPVAKQSYASLWQIFSAKENQQLWPIKFDWQALEASTLNLAKNEGLYHE